MNPTITKKNIPLIDDFYVSPNTSTVVFQFEPQVFTETNARLQKAAVLHQQIEGKDLYILDHFFSDVEGEEMRRYSESATFSRNSYGSREAIARGEKPAQSMNGKERWQFFAKPPGAIYELYKLLSTLSEQLNAEIMTLPWELCTHDSSSGSPSVIANRLEEASKESQELGKHQDCNPEERISFEIPVLYNVGSHPSKFINGAQGRPFLVSVMFYVTAPDFAPEHGLGTVFYDDTGNIASRVRCQNMRLVLFQGDIFHSIEESIAPKKSWRISYVYKLLINPREEGDQINIRLKQFFGDRCFSHGGRP